MEHNSYIARRRAKFSGIGGIPVNIPYGTALEVREGFILFDGRPVCAVTLSLIHISEPTRPY